jgi:polyisoprenoid-binding protein YceI
MLFNADITHSHVDFAVKHLMISTVRGKFSKFEGHGELNADGTLKSVSLTIETASIDTNQAQRDEHLRSPDFFDAANHPNITFVSTTIDQQGTDIAITGDLDMHGVKKTVTLKGEFSAPVKDPWGNQRAALQVSTKISRKDWGLTWNMALEAGGFTVSDEVKLSVEVEAVAAVLAAV